MQIKDVAKIANVAPSTVSRVMNKSGYVSPAVRKRVEETLAETGYVPNSVAKSLKSKKSNLIGVIVPRVAHETISQMLDGVINKCIEQGYYMALTNTASPNHNQLQALTELYSRQMDGIIFISDNISKEHEQRMDTMNIPILVIGQKLDDPQYIVYEDIISDKLQGETGESLYYYIGKTAAEILFTEMGKESSDKKRHCIPCLISDRE